MSTTTTSATSNMKIVTCNLPEPFIAAMEKLISEYGLYPSRSELVRVAVREFLIKELKVLDKFDEYASKEPDDIVVPELAPRPGQNLDMRTIRNLRAFHATVKAPKPRAKPAQKEEELVSDETESREALAAVGIEPARDLERDVLAFLAQNDDVANCTDLARKIEANPNGVQRMVARLEEERLVDRNALHVFLTQKGRAKVETLPSITT